MSSPVFFSSQLVATVTTYKVSCCRKILHCVELIDDEMNVVVVG